MIFRTCLLMLLAGIAFGQQTEPAPTYSLQVKTQLVALDVVVTDKHGQIVRNLTKDDFRVFEGKAEQTVRSIDLPGSETLAPNLDIHTSKELDRLAPNAPVTILVLDETNSGFDDQAFARYSLQKYLKAQGDRLEQPTMLVSVVLSKFYVLREFTTSRADVLSALDHHFASLSSHLDSGSFAGQQFSQALGSLIALAQATQGHPGHKNIVWIGQGFPTLPSGLGIEEDSSLARTIRRTTDILRDGRVTLSSISPTGVYKPGSSISDKIAIATYNQTVGAGSALGFDPFGTSIDFGVLVQATGGRELRGRNDVDNLIATGVRDGVEFYTLFYRPTELTDDEKQFRSIRVLLKDPALHATARTGYYPGPPPSAVPTATAAGKVAVPAAAKARPLYDVSFATRNTLVYDGVPLTVVRADPTSDNFRLVIKNQDIAWKDADEAGKRNAALTLIVMSFDRGGKLLERNGTVITVESTNADGRTVIPATAVTKMPTARLRFIVCDNTSGKIGADNVYFVDQKELSGSTTGLNH